MKKLGMSFALLLCAIYTPAQGAQPLHVLMTPYKQYGTLEQDDIAMLATIQALHAAKAPIITKQSIIIRLLKILDSQNKKIGQSISKKLGSGLVTLGKFIQSPLHAGMDTFVGRFAQKLIDPAVWAIYEHVPSESYVLVPQALAPIYGKQTVFNYGALKPVTPSDIAKNIDMSESIDDFGALFEKLLVYLKKDSLIFTDARLAVLAQRDYQVFTAADWAALNTVFMERKQALEKDFFDRWLKKPWRGNCEHGSVRFDAYVADRLGEAAQTGVCYRYNPALIKDIFAQDSGPWNILLIGHGSLLGYEDEDDIVAEFSREHFATFLHALNTDIKTQLFAYKSCSSGGINSLRHYWSDTDQKDIVLNFPVVCCCMNNWPVLINLTEFMPPAKQVPGLFLPPMLLGASIDKIDAYAKTALLDIEGFFAALSSPSNNLSNNALVHAIACLTPSLKHGRLYKRMTHIPKVRYAHQTSFEPLNIFPDDLVVLNSPVQTYTLENKRVAICCAADIDEITIKGTVLPAIVSGSPLSAIHHIKLIQSPVLMNVLLNSSFFFHPLKKDRHKYREFPYVQIFKVDKIIFPNSKSVTDVTIVLTDDEYIARMKYGNSFFWCQRTKAAWKDGGVVQTSWQPGANEPLFSVYEHKSRQAYLDLTDGLKRQLTLFMSN